MRLHLLDIEYHQGSDQRWSGHLNVEEDAMLILLGDNCEPCPFCGAGPLDLTLGNTHTPSYSIECKCGCELRDTESNGGHQKSHSAAVRAHRASIRRVVGKWQDRH